MGRMTMKFWKVLRTETKEFIFEKIKKEPGKDYKEKCHGQSNKVER